VSKATVRMAIADLCVTATSGSSRQGNVVTDTTPDCGITMKTKLTEDIFGRG